ncbi:MAG: replication protein [Pseudomonadota bacterium]|uniref:Putative DNA replication initiation protein n=1 Tax=viral metagenome TaxID=1070528 RepID=A0A6H1ZI92_9ZZZZ
MADVQPENGTTGIAHEILENLARINLSAYESRFLWLLFRKTYGFHKKTDWISLSQFSKELELDRRLIHRTIKKLKDRKMIIVETDKGKRTKYGFQKDYDRWISGKVSSKQMTEKQGVIHTDDKDGINPVNNTKKSGNGGKPTVIYLDDELSSIQIPTNNTNTNIKTSLVETEEFRLSKLLLDSIKNRRPSFKEPNLRSWSKEVGRMIRIDKREPEEISDVIEWCQEDDFWQNNILSTSKLRQKYDQLALKMTKTVKQAKTLNPYEDLF